MTLRDAYTYAVRGCMGFAGAYLIVIIVCAVVRTHLQMPGPNVGPMDGWVLGALVGTALVLKVISTDWHKLLALADKDREREKATIAQEADKPPVTTPSEK